MVVTPEAATLRQNMREPDAASHACRVYVEVKIKERKNFALAGRTMLYFPVINWKEE